MPAEERRPTLLVVDDEPAMLQALRHQFARDYRVLTAEGGREALEWLGREDVDVILSDQKMPGMDGDAFLAQARHVRPDAVRLIFTGYSGIQGVVEAVNAGQIFRYILKPFDPDELAGIIHQAAEYHHLVADRRRLAAELHEALGRLARLDAELREANALKRALMEAGQLRADVEDLARRVGALEAASAAGPPDPPSPGG